MASTNPYLTGGSPRSNNPYLGGGAPRSKKRKKKGGASVSGFIENLAGDAASSIAGLVPGAVEMADAVVDDARNVLTGGRGSLSRPGRSGDVDPLENVRERVLKPVAESYKYTYGPLIKGDFGEFASRVYEHPLGPMLDILTIASGGAAAAAKVGMIPSTASRAIRLSTPSGGEVTKRASRSPIRGGGQLAVDALLKKIPADRTPLGEFARAARVQKRQSKRRAVGNEYAALPLTRALGKLKNNEERVAAYLVATLPDPKSVDAYVERLRALPDDENKPLALQAVAIIEKARPVYDRVVNSYLTGTANRQTRRVVALRDEMAKLAAKNRDVAGSLVSPTSAAERPFLHMRVAEGAEYADDMGGPLTASGQPTPRKGVVGGPEVPELQNRLAQQGLPEPVYVPDVPAPQKVRADIRYSGGGGARQNRLASTKQNKGTLFTLGRMIQDPVVLSQGYLRTVKYAHYTDLYNLALDAGVWFRKGDELPKGWEPVPLPARPMEATVDGQTVIIGNSTETKNFLDSSVTDFEEWARQNLGKDFDVNQQPGALVNAFQSATPNNAVTGSFVRTPDGKILRNEDEMLAIPSSYLKTLRGEFTKSSKFIYLLNKYPMRVWRTLVLNLRPAWLVGNIVGNSMMFTVGEGGRGLRELGQGMLRLTKSPEEREAFQKLMDETFPTQQHGTFIDTQLPTYAPGSAGAKLQKGASIVTGGMAKIDQAFERSLRRAAVRTELRKHPALKKQAKSMKDDTAEFYRWAAEELDAKPELVTEIENRINDSLGDFTNLSKFEKEYVRSVFPFYAWFRAITAVTLKLPVTYPGRTLLLEKIGTIGAELQDDSFPITLQGLARVGGMEFNTMPLNPYATTIDLGRMVGGLAAGEPGKAGELFTGANPIVVTPAEFLFGRRLRTGAPVGGRGLIPSSLQGVYEGLPPVRLLESQGVNMPFYEFKRDGNTLYDRSQKSELLNYILGGLAPKKINEKRARELGKE